MDEQAADRHRTIVARLTIALGLFGIIRVIPELVAVLFWAKESINRRYAGVLVLDVALGVWALTGGWAMRRNSRWGWPTTTFGWAAVAANSILISLVMIPDELRRSDSKEMIWLLPRTTFYIASLLTVPYVLWASFTVQRMGLWFKVFVASVVVILVIAFWVTTAFIVEVDPITLHSSWAH